MPGRPGPGGPTRARQIPALLPQPGKKIAQFLGRELFQQSLGHQRCVRKREFLELVAGETGALVPRVDQCHAAGVFLHQQPRDNRAGPGLGDVREVLFFTTALGSTMFASSELRSPLTVPVSSGPRFPPTFRTL